MNRHEITDILLPSPDEIINHIWTHPGLSIAHGALPDIETHNAVEGEVFTRDDEQ